MPDSLGWRVRLVLQTLAAGGVTRFMLWLKLQRNLNVSRPDGSVTWSMLSLKAQSNVNVWRPGGSKTSDGNFERSVKC